MNEYLPVAIIFLIACFIGISMLLLGRLVRPSKYEASKFSAYECGVPAFSDARKRFNVKFYIVALLFVLFDVEIVFLFPWAAVFFGIGIYGLAAMFLFLIILIVGFLYEWKKGALEWV